MRLRYFHLNFMILFFKNPLTVIKIFLQISRSSASFASVVTVRQQQVTGKNQTKNQKTAVLDPVLPLAPSPTWSFHLESYTPQTRGNVNTDVRMFVSQPHFVV